MEFCKNKKRMIQKLAPSLFFAAIQKRDLLLAQDILFGAG
jgi:hypothetical protein